MRPILAITFLSICTSAYAFDDDEKCDPDSGTTYSQACVASQAGNKADKQLNAKYKKILSMYKKHKAEKEIKLLVAAQRAWIQYRDKVCEFEDQAFGGINSISWGKCVARITETRLSELNEIETD